MNDQQLHTYCQDWVTWCFTRRFYLRPGAQNILARMHPSKSGREPNARNIADMPHFHTAVHMLAEMPQHADTVKCFSLLYCEEADYVKRQADKLDIARSTFYRRAAAFARAAYSMSLTIKRMHEGRCPGNVEEREVELEPA